VSHDCYADAYVNMYNNNNFLYLDVGGDDADVLVGVLHLPAPPLQRVVHLKCCIARREVDERVPKLNLTLVPNPRILKRV
jgi:hypothetical protein